MLKMLNDSRSNPFNIVEIWPPRYSKNKRPKCYKIPHDSRTEPVPHFADAASGAPPRRGEPIAHFGPLPYNACEVIPNRTRQELMAQPCLEPYTVALAQIDVRL